jgi:rhomboid protease GluP
VTLALAAANSVVWLVMIAIGAGVINPSAQWLFEHGGNFGMATLEGEEWRLFTSMFIHAGLLHIAMNMFGLISGGRLVERLFGRAGFAAIYFISGLVGSLAAALQPGAVVSVGASGAIFGMLGAGVAYYLLHRERMDPSTGKEARGLLVFIAYNLLYGFTQTGIDMYAHIGGLLAGFACGLALEVGGGGTRRRTTTVAAIGLVAVIAAAFLVPTRIDEGARAFQAFADADQKIMSRWNELIGRAQRDEVGDEQFAEVIEQEILPPLRAARGAYEQSGAEHPKRALLLEYMRVRQEGMEQIAAGARAHDVEAVKRAQAVFERGDEILKKMQGESGP